MLWQLRHALNLASGTLLFGALLWGAANLWQSNSDATEAASLKTMAQRTLGETQKITLAFPNTFAPAADMKAGVSVMRRLKQYDSAPDGILRPLGAILDRHPQIELDNIAWKTDANEPVAPGTLADAPAQVIIIKGRLTGFANNYRTALNYLESFQRGLTAQGYQVAVLSGPLDASPGGSIADRHDKQAGALGFSLKISLRPPA